MKPHQPGDAPGRFQATQERALAGRFLKGQPLLCPECDAPLDVRPVPQRTDVSYVRDRVVVACPRCHRTAVLDRRESR